MKMFRLIGLVERAGSGLPRVVSVCNELGIPIPEIDEEVDPTRVTVRIRRDPKPPVPQGTMNCDDIDEAILEYLASHSGDSLKVTSEALGLSTSTLTRRISSLKEWGRIERVGSKKSGKWIVK